MVTDGAREDLIPITREVILTSVDAEWIWRSIEGGDTAMRHRKWIVLEVILPVVFQFVYWEIRHPAEGDVIFMYQFESVSASETYLSEDFADDLVLPRTEKYHISHFWRELGFQGSKLISREELEYRRFRTICFVGDVRESSSTVRLRYFRKGIDL